VSLSAIQASSVMLLRNARNGAESLPANVWNAVIRPLTISSTVSATMVGAVPDTPASA
jgi:hypothetical protein